MKTPTAGVINAIVHELLKVEAFETHADLTEAVKCRCARLRVPYDCGVVAEAIRSVGRTRTLLQGPRAVAPAAPRPLLPSVPNGGELGTGTFAVSRADAAAIMERLRAHLREMA